MNCVQEINCGKVIVVGIRGIENCGDSLSGLFINNLSGINLKTAAAIAPQEYEGGVQLFREKIKFATQIVKKDLKRFISPRFRFDTQIEDINKCEFTTGVFFWPATPLKRGVVIERVDARLAKIHIRRVLVRVKNSGVTNLYINDGNEEYIYEVNLVAGLNIINLDQSFESDTVYVTIPNDTFEMSQGDCDLSCGHCGGGKKSHHLRVSGWDGNSETSSLYGIRVEGHLFCDEDELFCNVLNQLYYVILLQSAVQILRERIDGPRLNNFTIFNTERAKELLQEYSAEYEVEYKSAGKSLDQYLKNISDLCITCKGNRYVSELPG